MKVLWLSNIILPDFCHEFGVSKTVTGGWLTGALNELEKYNELEIALCFPIIDESRLKNGACKGHKYFSVQCDLYSENYVSVQRRMINRFSEIIQEYTPDVVHIWGTEYPHTLALIEACEENGLLDRVVINIQGLVSVYAKHFLRGISEKYCEKKDETGKSMLSEMELYTKRGLLEISAIQKVQYVIGRTTWDRACTYWMNKNIKYYHCNEVLRTEFYKRKGIWKKENCIKHSIFISQGFYPIKGLHFLLDACVHLIKDYPDLKIYVAGSNILSNSKLTSYALYIKELLDKYRLQDILHFVGGLDENGMCEQYQKSNVFVMPSTIENSPNSLCEAMMIGVPIVAANVGGTNTLIEHEKEGFLYQYDAPYMLAFYIKEIFEGNVDIEGMSQKAVAKAGLINDKLMVGATIEMIYKEIIQNS